MPTFLPKKQMEYLYDMKGKATMMDTWVMEQMNHIRTFFAKFYNVYHKASKLELIMSTCANQWEKDEEVKLKC